MKSINRKRYTKERIVAGKQEVFDSLTNQWILMSLLSNIIDESSYPYANHSNFSGSGGNFGGGGAGGSFDDSSYSSSSSDSGSSDSSGGFD